jgi:DNA topoisomerase-3
MPDEYDSKYGKWKLEDLPIIPEVLRYKLKAGTKQQGRILQRLCKASDRIICGTDCDFLF